MITGPNFDKLLYILSSLLSLTGSSSVAYPFRLAAVSGIIFLITASLIVFVDLDLYSFYMSFCFLFSNIDELLIGLG
jgi:hypothetical protein